MKREEMDFLIRDTLRRDVTEQEPSDAVRANLMAKAEADNTQTELVVGTSIPPLVNGLREVNPILSGAARLPEFEAELMDFFGSAQQRLVSMWMLSTNSRY